ncbi:MAG: iron complex transport system permease protein [Granulosicoccus sp.]|jgi:iron complex transport system permease protein
MVHQRYIFLLVALVLFLSVISLCLGQSWISLTDVLSIPFTDPDSTTAVIVREIRLPRTLIAIVAGFSLGLSGAAMQGLLQNPLASPGLVGSSSGAALGAVTALYFFSGTLHPQTVPFAGMLGALLTTGFVYVLAGRDATVSTLILSGVAINALAGAGLSLLLNLAPSPFAVRELVLWTLGDLSDRSLSDLWVMLPCTLIGWLLLTGTGRSLDALTLGARTASSMGINTYWISWRIFIAISLCVGAAVATTGMIGFIGLVIPHLLRPLAQHQPGKLLPLSALGGAAMLLSADICVRLIDMYTSISVPLKVGVLTALVGAPFFLLLILRSRNNYLR